MRVVRHGHRLPSKVVGALCLAVFKITPVIMGPGCWFALKWASVGPGDVYRALPADSVNSIGRNLAVIAPGLRSQQLPGCISAGMRVWGSCTWGSAVVQGPDLALGVLGFHQGRGFHLVVMGAGTAPGG